MISPGAQQYVFIFWVRTVIAKAFPVEINSIHLCSSSKVYHKLFIWLLRSQGHYMEQYMQYFSLNVHLAPEECSLLSLLGQKVTDSWVGVLIRHWIWISKNLLWKIIYPWFCHPSSTVLKLAQYASPLKDTDKLSAAYIDLFKWQNRNFNK